MARDKTDNTSFDRDFGYLLPFFDRVEAAAAGLTAPGAGDELRRLMADEKDRWARIRELLAGAPGRAAGVHEAAGSTTSANPPARPAPGLTIGSLRRQH